MIALDPTQTTEFSLLLDRGKPEHDRPVFITRFLTAREVIRAYALQTAGRDRGAYGILLGYLAAAAVGIVGWRNVKRRDGSQVEYAPFSVDFKALTAAQAEALVTTETAEPPQGFLGLLEVLSWSEISELPERMSEAVRLAEDDRKKSASASASTGAASTTAAPTAAASTGS